MKIAIWHIVLERLDLISISLYIYILLLTVRSWDAHPLSCLCACIAFKPEHLLHHQPALSIYDKYEYLSLSSEERFFFSPSVLVVRDLLHWRINALTSFQPQLAQGRPRQLDLALLDHRHWTNRKGVDLWYLTSVLLSDHWHHLPYVYYRVSNYHISLLEPQSNPWEVARAILYPRATYNKEDSFLSLVSSRVQ